MFRCLRRRPEAKKAVKLIEPLPDVDQIAELTRILEKAGRACFRARFPGRSLWRRPEGRRDPVDVGRLLAGAARTIASVPYCWLATATAAGLPSMRPMGRLPRGPGDDDWTI